MISAINLRKKKSQWKKIKAFAPREHGAYPQLFFPLLSAYSLTSPSLFSVAWGMSALLAFFAHEPVLILLGHRGTRPKRERGREARWVAQMLGLGIALSIATAFFQADSIARWATLVPLFLALILAGLIWKKKEKTATGEAIAALAFASVSFPMMLHGAMGMTKALLLVSVWAATFLIGSFGARGVIQHFKNPRAMRPALAITGIIFILGGFLAWSGGPPERWSAAALLPTALLALGLGISTPHPRYLKEIGITLFLTGSISAGLLIVGLS